MATQFLATQPGFEPWNLEFPPFVQSTQHRKIARPRPLTFPAQAPAWRSERPPSPFLQLEQVLAGVG